MATVSEQRAEIAGVETFWRRAEPDAGSTPALFVHGAPDSSEVWLPFLEACGGVALDLPGFGRSGKPAPFDYSVAGYDRFLQAFLDHLGIARCSLVLHDWGAVALATAQRTPERFDRLVLFGCVPLLPGFRWHRLARLWRTPVVGEVTMGFSLRYAVGRALRKASATPIPAEFTDALYGHFDHGTQRATLKLHRAAAPATLERCGADLARVTAPALLLWPTQDPFVPARFGRAYANALGGEARLELVEGAGHWPWLDRPELVGAAVRFLGG